MTIGLAGKVCAGKDALVPWFLARGFTVIDADRLGHRALEARSEAVLARFGTLDRRALGARVFTDPQALADLEALTHPWIVDQVRQERQRAPGPVVINAALLARVGLAELCDLVVWVQAPLITRLLRARRRDGWPWGRLWARVWAQRTLRAQEFPPGTDIVRVDNRGSLPEAHRILERRLRDAGFSFEEASP